MNRELRGRIGIPFTHHSCGPTDIRTVQGLLGHANVPTIMIYLHIMKRPGAGAPSPLDPL